MSLVRIARRLSREVAQLEFREPVTHVYAPLDYARDPAEQYLKRYGRPGVELLLLGMNPGPFGMAQTGVPFGEVAIVREWLGIEGRVGRPDPEHPKRPVQGFDCARSEVSGRRLWGWARERFGDAGAFFDRCFVWNYCPLAFLEETGRNRTPDKLPVAERDALFAACDAALERVVDHLRPATLAGVGAFATQRLRGVAEARGLRLGTVLHPSPASPRANRGWALQAEADLEALGFEV